MKHFIGALFLSLAASAAIAGEVAGASEAVAAQPVAFRDLFNGDLTPSARAAALNGVEVALVGFMAPKEEFPFLILAGVPVDTCPYCDPPGEGDDRDAIPYVMVFADDDDKTYGPRQRLRVTGRLETREDAAAKDRKGLVVALVDAVVANDAQAADPRDEQPAPASVDGAAHIQGAEDEDGHDHDHDHDH